MTNHSNLSFKKTLTRDSCIVVAFVLVLLTVKTISGVAPDPLDAAEVDQFAEIGLARPMQVQRIATAFCEIDIGDFPIKLSPRLRSALADALEMKSKMPIPSVAFRDDVWGRGLFDHKSWTIILDSNLLASNRLSKKKWVRILRTFAHETRHAEQRYRAAQYQAAIGKSKANKHAYGNLPRFVVERTLVDSIPVGSSLFRFGKYVSEMARNQKRISHSRYIKKMISDAKTKGEEIKDLLKLYDEELPLERDADAFEWALERRVAECLEENPG